MEFLKKRSVAVIIAVAAAILALFIGTTLSLNREAKRIETAFTEGTAADGYTQPSIQHQLDNRASAAMSLVTIGNHYPELKAEAEELSQAQHELMDAKSIEEKYLCNEKLEKAYTALSEKLRDYVNSDDAAAFESYTSTLSGAQLAIGKTGYNVLVNGWYQSDRAAFPASVFGIFARGPQYFGVEG